MSQDYFEQEFIFQTDIEQERKTFMGSDKKEKDFTKKNIKELIESYALLKKYFSFLVRFVQSWLIRISNISSVFLTSSSIPAPIDMKTMDFRCTAKSILEDAIR